MTAAQDLVNDPLGFMDENILVVKWEGDQSNPIDRSHHSVQLYTLPLTKARGYRRNWRHSPLDVYFMAPTGALLSATAVADPHPFDVFFCPFHVDSTLGSVLTNAARLMFTTQMDGCSFGVGSKASTGERLVFHANAQTGNDTSAAMTSAQDRALRAAFLSQGTHIHGILGPVDYRPSHKNTEYAATTFGIRNGNNWTFHTQRFSVEASGNAWVYGWKEVKQFAEL